MKKLLVLAAVGVAVKYLLDTDKGSELKNQLNNWLGKAKDSFSDATNGVSVPKMSEI